MLKVKFLNDSDGSSTLISHLNTLKNATSNPENIFRGNINTNNNVNDLFNTREELLASVSHLPSSVIENLREIFSGLSQQNNGLIDNQEISFKSNRIKITEGEFHEFFREDILNENGNLGLIKTLQTFDCGCNYDSKEIGGVCSFNHFVCKSHLRWCDRGNHPSCSLDSVIITKKDKTKKDNEDESIDIRYCCVYHYGLMYLRTWPGLKFQVARRFFSKHKHQTNLDF